MTAPLNTCPQCAAGIRPGDRFCENCGAVLSEVRTVAIPQHGLSSDGPCADCGNTDHTDGYCTVCGHRRADPDRDQAELGPVLMITDRGLQHPHNEDAAAAGIIGSDAARPHAIAIAVCDGVSSSTAAHTAAVAASAAGVDAMLAAFGESRSPRAVVTAGLQHAAMAAAGAQTDPSHTPSCTYTAAIVVPKHEGTVDITVGNVGDSRAYWLPVPPGTAVQLTVDDSVSQELIAAGVAADSEAVQRGAHTLTRWLGADGGSKPWSDKGITAMTASGAGTLLLCSDGLWNYLPDATDIARLCSAADITGSANALVEYALAAGGHDNITVALIPIGDPS